MPLAGPPLSQPVDLAAVLDAGLRARPDAAALVTLDRTWSWRDMELAATRLAGRYLALGLAPGDRVASLMPNRGALIVHYIACFKAGLVATPLNYRYQPPEIDHALDVSGAAAIVAHAERGESLAASRCVPQLRLGRIVFGGDAADRAHPRLEDLMAAEAPSPPPLAPPPPDAPAVIFFTSGSTGKPKGVTHSHGSFGWLVASAVAGLGIRTDDVFLPATSASHVASSSLSLAGLAAGARVAMARTFGPDELLPLLRATRPTLLCMTPASLFNLVRDPAACRDDFQSLRRCVAGGDKISPELDREYAALAGHDIEELYGMTEIGTSTYNPAGAGNRVGSIGQPAPGFLAAVREDDGRESPVGAAGRLWLNSRSMMTGYWNRPDATAETIVNGWLDTGDLCAADADGYLWFHGRKKQIIVHDGSNICPQEVEDALVEHPAVAAAGVIGIHDLVHGENVRAYVVFRPGAPIPSAADLIRFAQARVGYKAPSEIVVLDELPLNAVGKVDRPALVRLAENAAHRR
jgi:acyl-CoA synthetase (AMP-forming)/AMP-acid ligase II